MAGDVTKQSDIDAAVKRAVDTFGKLDIVINNAGLTFRNKPMLEVSEAEFDKVFAINVKSIFLITNAVVPVRGNRRVVASSTSARQQVLVRGLD